jgi:hypothetical protein
MKNNILIFGAGSIGNHMAYAARKLNYDVEVTDINKKALLRMKDRIFPKRYGYWDKKIKLINYEDAFNQKKIFELVIIGTPPKTHKKLFNIIQKKILFKKLLIEKPLCTFKEKLDFKSDKFIFCGYNHSVSKSFSYFLNKIKWQKDINLIDINWREGFSGILNAHFWMKNEYDSYLGDITKGGGAIHEHSHGLHLAIILLRIFKKLNKAKIKLSSVYRQWKKLNYDKFSNILIKNNKFILNYTCDLITEPANKSVLLSGKNFTASWHCSYKKNTDVVIIVKNNKKFIKKFKKNRSSEFENELLHIQRINKLNSYKKSFLSLDYAVEVMKIIKKINEK